MPSPKKVTVAPQLRCSRDRYTKDVYKLEASSPCSQRRLRDTCKNPFSFVQDLEHGQDARATVEVLKPSLNHTNSFTTPVAIPPWKFSGSFMPTRSTTVCQTFA